jgi:hypothetical protein
VFDHPENSSSSTDTQPALKHECHSKTAERMFSKSFMKHFKGFGSRFIKLNAKLDADMLLDFAIHRIQNKTRS